MKVKLSYTSRKNYVFLREDVLRDYKIVCESRQLSLLGRKEVLTGKAKFGIFGDGKELPQVAMAKVFRNGDWRSGYYRDQTFMLAAGIYTPGEFFAQLYGDTDLIFNPGNGGRLMNNHFATRSLDEKGNWKNLSNQKNSSADISPTAGQMPRLLGLALASKLYRQNTELHDLTEFSITGNEVAFGTIGDASTSEGPFWETLNAAGVLQVPMATSIWDDGYGISVPIGYQTTKQSISEVLSGFASDKNGNGFAIFTVKGWDYEALCTTYDEAISFCRENHKPVIIHVQELTQPQGHSTSGSHERYKSTDRLAWEKTWDCNLKFKEWILEKGLATPEELETIETEAVETAKSARENAWQNYLTPLKQTRDEFLKLVDVTSCECAKTAKIEAIKQDLSKISEPIRKDIMSSARQILRLICNSCSNPYNSLKSNVTGWLIKAMEEGSKRYSSHLYSESAENALNVEGIDPVYPDKAPLVPGREILREFWEASLARDKRILMFGEDVGRIGGVNQTLEGLQARFGELRVTDTGIREATIIGQGVGLAMRGLRPVAEIQYFDYLMYAIQVVSDDLATLQFRTRGGQKAPLIISTRGHRLEGVWHSGSALSMVINSIRGVYVLVPRDMTQAAGLYNTMLHSDEPALLIEPLNAYRLREKKPSNIGEYRIPLGVPEIIQEGSDVTLVTYGSCVRIAQDAVKQLINVGISVELIDVQALPPFEFPHFFSPSFKKTNKKHIFI